MTTALIIYIVGVILAYPRVLGSFYQLNKDFIKHLPPDRPFPFYIFSWLAVVTGVIVYFLEHEEHFWKWSYSDLWEEYRKNNPK